MAETILTAARVKGLKPRKTTRDIRDANLRGFGVRVLPTGRKRFFVQCQYRGERIWKMLGDAGAISLDEARASAVQALAAIRRGEEAPYRPDETLFEAVAETVFERHARLWKAGTLKVNRGYLRKQILPHFAGRQIAEIDRQEVRRWFACLRATPVAADRSMPVLSVIMREAEAMGMRPEGSNPLPGHPSLPPQGPRAVRLRRGHPPPVLPARRVRGPMARTSRVDPPAAAHRPAARARY